MNYCTADWTHTHMCTYAHTCAHTYMHTHIQYQSYFLYSICGLDAELLSARECYEKCPIIRYDDLQVSSNHSVITIISFAVDLLYI